MKSKGVLIVRNAVQKALFEQELNGQISDGYWENSRPYDHWKSFRGIEVRVVQKDSHGNELENVGITNWTHRKSKSLTSYCNDQSTESRGVARCVLVGEFMMGQPWKYYTIMMLSCHNTRDSSKCTVRVC